MSDQAAEDPHVRARCDQWRPLAHARIGCAALVLVVGAALAGCGPVTVPPPTSTSIQRTPDDPAAPHGP